MLGTKSNFADQNKIVELNKIDKISQPVQVCNFCLQCVSSANII